MSGAKELMVVDAVLAPEGSLVMEDVAAFVERSVVRAPEDAAGVSWFWRQVVAHEAVVLEQGSAVVVPVNGHGESIGDEGTPSQAC